MDILKCYSCDKILCGDSYHFGNFYHDEKWNWHSICCKCYINKGGRPCVWHDECMEQFRLNKMEKSK